MSKDLAVFTAEAEEGVYSESELKAAQQCAGELLWVSQRTRPDLSFVASLVGSLATKAPRRAVQIAEKTIAFLQRTIDYTLIFESEQTGILGYSDASFAPEGARSHGGWVVMYNGCLVSWKSSRQPTVTLSTAESELTAIAEAMLALQSVSAMLQDVSPQREPVQLYTGLHIRFNPLRMGPGDGGRDTSGSRARGFAELLASKDVEMHHCAGELQIADLLTKALPSQRIKTLSSLMKLAWPGRGQGGSQDQVCQSKQRQPRSKSP